MRKPHLRRGLRVLGKRTEQFCRSGAQLHSLVWSVASTLAYSDHRSKRWN
jgi:hypothetical protein